MIEIEIVEFRNRRNFINNWMTKKKTILINQYQPYLSNVYARQA